jgi:hypothetical protein
MTSGPMEMEPNKIVLTKWFGRFGIRLFTYVFVSHLADKFGLKIYGPSIWEGTRLFRRASEIGVVTNEGLRTKINETEPTLDSIEYRRIAIDAYNREAGDQLRMACLDDPSEYGLPNLAFENLCCWRSWLFGKYSRQDVLTYLDFSDEVKSSSLYRYYKSLEGTYDVAHVRRGDITYRKDANGYSVVSLESYQAAFRKFGCDPGQIVFVSDDASLRTPKYDLHDPPVDGPWNYPTGEEPIPNVFYPFFQDFLKMIFARRFFRANSSFSWWAGFLNTGSVYAPVLRDRVYYPSTGRQIHCDFELGNEPHWYFLEQEPCARIRFADARPRETERLVSVVGPNHANPIATSVVIPAVQPQTPIFDQNQALKRVSRANRDRELHLDWNTPEGVLIIHDYVSRQTCQALSRYALWRMQAEDGVRFRGEQSCISPVCAHPRGLGIRRVEIDGVVLDALNLLNDTFCRQLASFYDVDFAWYERPHILHSVLGYAHLPLADADVWIPEEGGWSRIHDRDYSVLLFLNGNYRGGDFHFSNWHFRVKPKRGMLLAFPSNWNYLYSSQPIASGDRYAIASRGAVIGSRRVHSHMPYDAVFLRQQPAATSRPVACDI